ncbi:MAG: hypothetical protein KAG14_00940 [Mycoplasmataceae bacterium]|nr:hypothetical protein [Mycoplasmataceae bacterium]
MKIKTNKNKYLRIMKIASIVILSFITLTCIGFIIYLSLNQFEPKIFSSKHISWIDWVNKEQGNQQHYKLFIVSPSESKIYVETSFGKYIVDAHIPTLNSALSIDPSSGKYHFTMFNNLLDINNKLMNIGIHTPSDKSNELILPLSLMTVSIVSIMSACAIYRGTTSKKCIETIVK